MIDLKPASEMLKRQPSIIFFPESPTETAMIRGVLAAYVAIEEEADTSDRHVSTLVTRMILDTLQEFDERDPKQGGAKLCVSFPNNQSLVIQRAFEVVCNHNAGLVQSGLATKILGFDLGGERAA